LSREFNPAFYVTFLEDGGKVLELPGQLLWLSHAFPGWRITSDGMDMATCEKAGQDGERTPFTILIGHVALIDNTGKRIMSAPTSVELSDGDCAQEWFEIGASTVLNMFGFNVSNITADQWQEYYAFKNGEVFPDRGVKEADVHSTNTGTTSGAFSFLGNLFGKKETPIMGEGENGGQTEKKIGKVTNQITLLDDAEEVSYDEALRQFRNVLVYSPQDVPSYTQRTNVDSQKLKELFEDFCITTTGANWDMSTTTERSQILSRMKEILDSVM
jgi:hypothetical protein